jgi:hypothetical protein
VNITVILDNTPNLKRKTGGGYAVTDVEVHIASDMSPEFQQTVVVHEILEAYLPFLQHDKIDNLTALIIRGLKQL